MSNNNAHQPRKSLLTGRRLLPVAGALVATFLSAEVLANNVCEGFSALTDGGRCGQYRVVRQNGTVGRPICACPVDTSGGQCSSIDEDALLAVYQVPEDSNSGALGTFPQSDVTSETLKDVDGSINENATGIGYDLDAYGTFDGVDAAVSPDGTMFALGARDENGSQQEVVGSLLRCNDAETSGGWKLRRFMSLSSRMMRWGIGNTEQRVLYFQSASSYRLTMSREPVTVVDRNGEQHQAIRLDKLETLANKSGGLVTIADSDMNFADYGDGQAPRIGLPFSSRPFGTMTITSDTPASL